ITGRSTTVSISLGIALVAGRKRVPSPATGNTALRMRLDIREAAPSLQFPLGYGSAGILTRQVQEKSAWNRLECGRPGSRKRDIRDRADEWHWASCPGRGPVLAAARGDAGRLGPEAGHERLPPVHR